MPTQTLNVPARVPRLLPLAACLATILGVSFSDARADVVQAHARTATQHGKSYSGAARTPSKPSALTHTVDTCLDDNSQNSLRTLTATAGEGDIIDLAHLPMGCSKITLDTTHVPPYIKVSQNKLYFEGPGKELLTLDGNGETSILRHVGIGELHVTGMTISNGKYINDTNPIGGCIFSAGHVILTDSTVTGCAVGSSGSVTVGGGGIYAAGYLTMKGSTVTNSAVHSFGSANAYGGGVTAKHIDLEKSTLSHNYVLGGGLYNLGGGAFLFGNYAHISDSTISGNEVSGSGAGGGFYASVYGNAVVKIVNSTISSNRARASGGLSGPTGMEIDNSTIAFNRADSPTGAGGVFFDGNLTLRSSIVADNRGASGPSDLEGLSVAAVSGDHNLVTSVATGLTLPSDTITSCPRLQNLADNGGTTLTHDLMHDSPAIDVGSNPLHLMLDQTQGPRELPVADIGAVEWNGGPDDRIAISGFDGLCDQ